MTRIILIGLIALVLAMSVASPAFAQASSKARTEAAEKEVVPIFDMILRIILKYVFPIVAVIGGLAFGWKFIEEHKLKYLAYAALIILFLGIVPWFVQSWFSGFSADTGTVNSSE